MASGVVREDAIRMDAAKGGSGTYGKKIRKQKKHGEQTRELQTEGGGGVENREELEKCMYIIYRDTLDFLETLAFISHTVDGLRLASNILERRMYSGCILQHSNHHK